MNTPRTDACAKSIDQSNFADSWKDDFEEFAWVPADFARTIEIELTAAREEINTLKTMCISNANEANDLRQQRDRLAEALLELRNNESMSLGGAAYEIIEQALQSLNQN